MAAVFSVDQCDWIKPDCPYHRQNVRRLERRIASTARKGDRIKASRLLKVLVRSIAAGTTASALARLS